MLAIESVSLLMSAQRASLGKLLLLPGCRAVAVLSACFSVNNRRSKLQTVLSKLLKFGLFLLSFV